MRKVIAVVMGTIYWVEQKGWSFWALYMPPLNPSVRIWQKMTVQVAANLMNSLPQKPKITL